ncbi:MAG TPA: aminopeptidase P family N-terminal domain-containing protein [Chloroflexota bacterium]|nr:aminopeptidase P family N-terminal domain-containing protein [Chloroflexota bacterium]
MDLAGLGDYQVEGFTLAERDRRWQTVRTLMAEAGIDVLIVPTEDDSRYLTQMAFDIGPAIVAPDGPVTALTSRGRVGSAAIAWTPDIRVVSRRWIAGIVERLEELEADRKIIGIVGLDPTVGEPDGRFNYQTLVTLREVFSHARWVGATGLMEEARFIKSPEEIHALERAAAVSDAALIAACAHLARGASDREIAARAVQAAIEAGGDLTTTIEVALRGWTDVGASSPIPIGRTAGEDSTLVVRAEGRYLGYRSRGVQMAAVAPPPPSWMDGATACADAWYRAFDRVRSDRTIREVQAAGEAASAGGIRTGVVIRGQGIGDDFPGPGSVRARDDPRLGRPLAPGACFSITARAQWRDRLGPHLVRWGDTVVVSAAGPRRLGSRDVRIFIGPRPTESQSC